MRGILFVLVLAANGSAAAGPSTPATPLFDAFKTFCVATDAEPAAVASAVKAAGGTQFRPPSATDFPVPMTVASWNVEVAGQQMLISAGGSFPSKKIPPFPGPATDSYICSIDDRTNNDRASVAALQKWIEVAPYDVSHEDSATTAARARATGIPDEESKSFAEATKDLTMYFYAYADVNGAHIKIVDPAARRNARREGRNRQLVILQNSQGVSLQYMRDLPMPDRR